MNLLRLRALRVEVDVALALGELTIEEAAGRLGKAVPLDAETARQEAVFFAGNSGQAMSYLVGKQQILALLTEAAQRDGFALNAFHDDSGGKVTCRWHFSAGNHSACETTSIAPTTWQKGHRGRLPDQYARALRFYPP